MKINTTQIIKSFIVNENSAIAPRLQNASIDDNIAFLKWQSEVESIINEIRIAHSNKDIPEEVSLFGNSYLHDSIISAISVSKNNVKISFIAAENFRKIKIHVKFTNANIIYYNPENETSIMDTRIHPNSNEKCIVIWLGDKGIAVIEFNSIEIRCVLEKKNISLNELSKFETYGGLLVM